MKYSFGGLFMSLDKNEKVTNYVNKVFADLSERIDVSRENGSDVFKKQLFGSGGNSHPAPEKLNQY